MSSESASDREETRLSEFARVVVDSAENRVIVQTREETGRGKRFGSAGEVSLDGDEAITLLKVVLDSFLEGEASPRRTRGGPAPAGPPVRGGPWAQPPGQAGPPGQQPGQAAPGSPPAPFGQGPPAGQSPAGPGQPPQRAAPAQYGPGQSGQQYGPGQPTPGGQHPRPPRDDAGQPGGQPQGAAGVHPPWESGAGPSPGRGGATPERGVEQQPRQPGASRAGGDPGQRPPTGRPEESSDETDRDDEE